MSKFEKVSKHRLLGIGLVFFILVINSGTAFGKEKVYLDIYNPELTPFPIAIADFTSPRREDHELAQKIQEVVINDLSISGLFRVVGSQDFPLQAWRQGVLADFSEAVVWEDLEVDAVLTGNFWITGNSMVGTFQLYSVVEKKVRKGLRYEGKTKDWRLIAHRIANEVVGQLTDDQGIFDTKIAFVSKKTGNKEVYMIDFDGANCTQLTRNGSINILPRWRSDGKIVYFTSFMKRNPDLYALDLRSQKCYRISSEIGINASPAWSPDGKKMILMLTQNGHSHLFLKEAGGKKSLQLTSGRANYTSPSWSPDGKKIAFVSDRSGNPQIYLMDIQTRKIDRLTQDGQYNVSPAWSPKGDWIAFCSRQAGHFEIYLISPNGGYLRQLTRGNSNYEEPSWSPEGRYLAFTSTKGGQASIYIMNVNGTHQRKLTMFEGWAMNPAWSPYAERKYEL